MSCVMQNKMFEGQGPQLPGLGYLKLVKEAGRVNICKKLAFSPFFFEFYSAMAESDFQYFDWDEAVNWVLVDLQDSVGIVPLGCGLQPTNWVHVMGESAVILPSYDDGEDIRCLDMEIFGEPFLRGIPISQLFNVVEVADPVVYDSDMVDKTVAGFCYLTAFDGVDNEVVAKELGAYPTLDRVLQVGRRFDADQLAKDVKFTVTGYDVVTQTMLAHMQRGGVGCDFGKLLREDAVVAGIKVGADVDPPDYDKVVVALETGLSLEAITKAHVARVDRKVKAIDKIIGMMDDPRGTDFRDEAIRGVVSDAFGDDVQFKAAVVWLLQQEFYKKSERLVPVSWTVMSHERKIWHAYCKFRCTSMGELVANVVNWPASIYYGNRLVTEVVSVGKRGYTVFEGDSLVYVPKGVRVETSDFAIDAGKHCLFIRCSVGMRARWTYKDSIQVCDVVVFPFEGIIAAEWNRSLTYPKAKSTFSRFSTDYSNGFSLLRSSVTAEPSGCVSVMSLPRVGKVDENLEQRSADCGVISKVVDLGDVGSLHGGIYGTSLDWHGSKFGDMLKFGCVTLASGKSISLSPYVSVGYNCKGKGGYASMSTVYDDYEFDCCYTSDDNLSWNHGCD